MTNIPEMDISSVLMGGSGTAMIALALRYLVPLFKSAAERTQTRNEADTQLINTLTTERDRAVLRLEQAEARLSETVGNYHKLEMQLTILQRDLKDATDMIQELRQQITQRTETHG